MDRAKPAATWASTIVAERSMASAAGSARQALGPGITAQERGCGWHAAFAAMLATYAQTVPRHARVAAKLVDLVAGRPDGIGRLVRQAQRRLDDQRMREQTE